MINRRRALTPLLAPLLPVLLAGCAASNIDANHTPKAESGRGVVMGSITYSGYEGGYSVFLQSVDSDAGPIRVQHGAGTKLIPIRDKRNEALGYNGSVFAIELPAGRYVVKSWQVDVGGIHIVSTAPSSNVVFEVEAGRATYLGNFHFLGQRGRFGLPGGATVTMAEKFERDQAVIRQTFPGLSAVEVSRSLEPGTKLENLGGDSDRRFDPPVIFVPVRR